MTSSARSAFDYHSQEICVLCAIGLLQVCVYAAIASLNLVVVAACVDHGGASAPAHLFMFSGLLYSMALLGGISRLLGTLVTCVCACVGFTHVSGPVGCSCFFTLVSDVTHRVLLQMAQKHRVHLDADALTASEQSVGLSTGKCGSQKQTVHLVLSVQELVSVSFKLREQNLEKSDCQTHGNLQLQTNGVVVAVDEILQDILEFVAEDELKTSKHNEASASPVVVEHLGTPGGTLTCSAADSKIDNAETHDDAVQVTMTVVQGVVVRLEVDIGGSMHDCFPEMSEAPSDRSQATVAVVDHLVEELAVTPCMHVHAKVSPDDNDVAAVDEVLGDLLDAVDVLEV